MTPINVQTLPHTRREQKSDSAIFNEKTPSLITSLEKAHCEALKHGLPNAIKALIVTSEYWTDLRSKRYRMLIRQGYEQMLLYIAAEAHTKANPPHWFARVASKKKWEMSLCFFNALIQVRLLAQRLAKAIKWGLNDSVYRICWWLSEADITECVNEAMNIDDDVGWQFWRLARHKLRRQQQTLVMNRRRKGRFAALAVS